MILQTNLKMFINGEFIDSKNCKWKPVYNPATGEIITKIPEATEEDVQYAVSSARKAFEEFEKSTLEYRSELLYKIALIIENNKELFAYTETLDTGKPIKETLNIDVIKAISHLKYFASAIRTLEGSSSFVDKNLLSINLYEPYGVVAEIIPWNFPLLIAIWKIAPAIAAGNTIVLKPSSSTPISVVLLMDLIKDIVPKGVINVVTGSGGKCGNYLKENDDIDKISFTGSTNIGRDLYISAAKKIIPASLELGGKSANIFFSDCNIELAIEGAKLGILLNQGQTCAAGSRIFVQKDFYDLFVKKLIDVFKHTNVGDPLDYKTEMGSLISNKHLNEVLGSINKSLNNGAKLLTGGKRIYTGILKNGNFLEPTLIEADNNMEVSQMEIFGPVAVVIPFDNEEDVIKMANESNYGLAGGVFTKDINKAFNVVSNIKTGRMWINTYNQFPAGAMFGGYKESGVGKEMHKRTVLEYSQEKNILLNLNENPTNWYL